MVARRALNGLNGLGGAVDWINQTPWLWGVLGALAGGALVRWYDRR